MRIGELLNEVEDWFWKLEYNPENGEYELYLGIPNDWVYSENNDPIHVELLHQLDENSIIKITSTNENDGDGIIDFAKILVFKNKELEKRKEEHKLEMEKLKDLLIEKERNFLDYIDKVKDGDIVSESVIDAVKDAVDKVIEDQSESNVSGDTFIEDIEKLKLS